MYRDMASTLTSKDPVAKGVRMVESRVNKVFGIPDMRGKFSNNWLKALVSESTVTSHNWEARIITEETCRRWVLQGEEMDSEESFWRGCMIFNRDWIFCFTIGMWLFSHNL